MTALTVAAITEQEFGEHLASFRRSAFRFEAQDAGRSGLIVRRSGSALLLLVGGTSLVRSMTLRASTG